MSDSKTQRTPVQGTVQPTPVQPSAEGREDEKNADHANETTVERTARLNAEKQSQVR